jgi:hypothetical protein
MENLGIGSKFLRFLYKQIFLRFSGQIRDPYIIRIDNIFTDPDTNELSVSFHIANKRISQDMTVAEFVKSDMVYLIDPRIVFDMGQQFGAHSEKLEIIQKTQPTLKNKCVIGLKRVFIDE